VRHAITHDPDDETNVTVTLHRQPACAGRVGVAGPHDVTDGPSRVSAIAGYVEGMKETRMVQS
jgi:hypothetical protein